VAHAAWSARFARLPRPQQIEACALGRGEPARTDDGVDALPATGEGLLRASAQAALPGRMAWVRRWRGRQRVFWGHHVVVPGAVVAVDNTINVESGCFIGFALSAYIQPAGQVVQVPGTGKAWRSLVGGLLPVQGIVFPHSVDGVRATLAAEGLVDVDDYLAWIAMHLEAESLSLPDSIWTAHAAIAAKALQAPPDLAV
jgi:hypothetical protein